MFNESILNESNMVILQYFNSLCLFSYFKIVYLNLQKYFDKYVNIHDCDGKRGRYEEKEKDGDR